MIKHILAMTVILFLTGCSSGLWSTDKRSDVVPVFGEYKPVTYSQTLIEESVDADKNVTRTPVHVTSAATYWKNGYYVVPNTFLNEKKPCVNCLVTFVKTEDIDCKQGVVSNIEWAERKNSEYTFSGWVGRNNITYYSYVYDLAEPVTGHVFIQHMNSVNEPTTRTLYTGSVTPAGIMAGAPLFNADQKIVGMVVAFDNLTINPKNTLYIDKSEVEKDWETFNVHNK